MIEFLKVFLATETPFALLFIALFFYVIKRNRANEERLQKIIDTKLDRMNEEMKVMLKVWQILLEKEIKQQQEEDK